MIRSLMLIAALTAVTVPAAAQDPAWRLSVDQVKAITGRVSAGRSLQPASWPNGARVAVLLSFDVDNQTPALGTAPDPRAVSIGTLSRGEYGARVGLQRVLDVLDRGGIPASFFVPAVSFELHPEMVAAIRKSGRHEFAVHGWIHEQNPTLPADVERELIVRARATLERLTGVKPVGYRAPLAHPRAREADRTHQRERRSMVRDAPAARRAREAGAGAAPMTRRRGSPANDGACSSRRRAALWTYRGTAGMLRADAAMSANRIWFDASFRSSAW